MQDAEEMRVALEIRVPSQLIETVVEGVATRLAERLEPDPEAWVGVESAADRTQGRCG